MKTDKQPRAINTNSMSREDWLSRRKNTIGGSEVATILGLNEYQTPYQLWEEKTGRREPRDLTSNEAVIFGTLLEDVIANEFSRRTGRKVRRDNSIRLHPVHPFLTGNIDRLILGDDNDPHPGILEIKTVNGYSYRDWETALPPGYFCQIQHYFSITGYTYGAFAILVDGRKLEILEIKADPDYINYQVARLVNWYNEHIVNGTPPPKSLTDFNESSHIPELIKECNEEIFNTYLDILQYKVRIKELEEKKSAAEEVLKAAIGDAEGIAYGSELLATWKTQESSRFDTTAFKNEHKELYNLFTKPSRSRVFRLKELK